MSYEANADHHADQLLESLSEEDITYLKSDLNQLGFNGWIVWSEKNRNEANDYLRATEKQREKLKKWKDPVLRRRLVFSAYHQARLAASMIHAASRLSPGGSYRQTTAYAASLAFEVMRDGDWRWPFLDTEPPEGWPGPRFEPYITVAVSVPIHGKAPKPPEIRQGYTAT